MQTTSPGLGDADSRPYAVALWIVIGLLAVVTLIAAIREDAWNALTAGAFLLGFLVFVRTAGRPPRAVLTLAAAAVTMNAAGWTWDLYKSVWGFDEFAHAFGTAAAVLLLANYGYQPLFSIWTKHWFSVSLAVFSLGVAIGATWEVAEWLGFYVFGTRPDRIFDDILSDLLCDAAGAVASVPIGYWAYAGSET